MNSFLGIGSLILSSTFLHPSDIGNLDISSCLEMVRKPCPTTFGGMSLGCCASGRPLVLVHSSLCFFFSCDLVSVVRPFDLVYPFILQWESIQNLKANLRKGSKKPQGMPAQ